MASLDYSSAGVPVRQDMQDAHAYLLEHVRSPGAWWTGAERIAIAAESRNALDCPLCRARKSALTPGSVEGEHKSLGGLPEVAVEVIHRVRTDPARLSRRWFDGVIGSGLLLERYVELVGVVTLLAGVDYVCRSLGIPPFPLPDPLPGEPSRRRPASAKPGSAWVPMIAPEDVEAPEADMYGGGPFIPNIVRALSLVPDAVRALRRLSDAHYVPVGKLADPTARRALDRMQIELVAARVSALNECFY